MGSPYTREAERESARGGAGTQGAKTLQMAVVSKDKGTLPMRGVREEMKRDHRGDKPSKGET